VIKKQMGEEYIYYRCTKYNSDRMKQPEPIRAWFQKTLGEWIQDQQT
jgi:hypothetical protein